MENPFQIINEKLDNIEKILSQIKTGQVTEKPFVVKQLKELMNVKEVAEYFQLVKVKFTSTPVTDKYLLLRPARKFISEKRKLMNG